MNIDYDADMDRHYIPVHPDWEIQTKGKGSSFRLANTVTGKRWMICDTHTHAPLEQMARDVNSRIEELERVARMALDFLTTSGVVYPTKLATALRDALGERT